MPMDILVIEFKDKLRSLDIIIIEVQKMLNFLLKSDKSRATTKLSQLGLVPLNNRLAPTPFRPLALLVINQVLPRKLTSTYLKVLKNNTPTPELLLKQAVFVHLLLQESNKIDSQSIIDLLGSMLEATVPLLEQYRSSQAKQGGGQSCCGRSVSTRSQQIVICKQVLLLSTIIRPYLGYLMRIAATFDSYRTLNRASSSLKPHQIWSILNLLKTIASIANQFTMIGRYFIRQYGELVVLLSKTLSRDVDNLVVASNVFVRGAASTVVGEEEQAQFGRLLEEIGVVNEKLMTLYFGKYFFQSMREVNQPKWVNTNAKEYDRFFRVKERGRILCTE